MGVFPEAIEDHVDRRGVVNPLRLAAVIFGGVVNKTVAVALVGGGSIRILEYDTGTENVLRFEEERANGHLRNWTRSATLSDAVIGCHDGYQNPAEADRHH